MVNQWYVMCSISWCGWGVEGFDLEMSISEGRSFFQALSLRLSNVSNISRVTSKSCHSTHSICAMRNSFASWSLTREKSLL